jgi:hypothetical protein
MLNNKIEFAVICFSIIIMFSPIRGTADEISLGMRVPMPVFSWSDNSAKPLGEDQQHVLDFAIENLVQAQKINAQWNLVVVRQWIDGPDGFSRLRKIIKLNKENNQKVGLRLLEDPKTYKNLSKTLDNEHGFNLSYYAWVKSLAEQVEGDVKYFMIGNEIETPNHTSPPGYPGVAKIGAITYPQYKKILTTAALALTNAAHNIQLVNGGFSDKTLALAVADDIKNRQSLADAVIFWRDWKEVGGRKAEGAFGMLRQLSSKKVRAKIEFVKSSLADNSNGDLFQFHYYGGWKALTPILNWMNTEMLAANAQRELIPTEIGFQIKVEKKLVDGKLKKSADLEAYSALEHQNQLVKNFAILAGSGTNKILYWNIRRPTLAGQIVPLYKPTTTVNQFQPTQAVSSYKMLAKFLNGSQSVPARMKPLPGVYEYRFSGAKDFSIVWAGQRTQLTLDGVNKLYDINGKLLTNDKQSIITLTETPVIIEWDPSTAGEGSVVVEN